jgi:arylesterase/paraoxonase
MNIKKGIGIVALLGLVLYGGMAAKTLRPFARIHPQGGDGCRLVHAPGLQGAEDMDFDAATNTLWIVAANRRLIPNHRPRQGQVFRYQPDSDAEPQPVPVVGMAADFRPHGMGLWRDAAGLRLFTVQHGDAAESVEIFAIEPDGAAGGKPQLRHLRSVVSPSFVSLNDVTPVGPESFYASNDHGGRPPLSFLLEDFLFLSRASIAYFDGKSGRIVAGGLRYANGITADRGGRLLVVAETMGERITIFARQDGGDLEKRSSLSVGTAVDNFAQDESGAYWVAAHPVAMQFLKHAKSDAVPSASQVLRFTVTPAGQVAELSTRLMEDGTKLSASSVAVAFGRHLVVGPVFQPGVLVCPR